jgi:BirA family biotin operon repressor/biotin-[acetyl-CoA-carboxylase] ligase
MEWVFLEETDSTNRVAKELARQGAPHGTAVLAKRQTAGRGRLGRSFFSPEGGLYLSVILRPQCKPDDLALMTPMAAVAVCRALEELCIAPRIKWVNDLYLGDKKLCGILCEGCGDAVIVGIGLNLYTPEGGFPADIPATALDVPVDRMVLAEAIRKQLLQPGDFLEEYRSLCLTVGKTVTVHPVQGEPYEARALEIDHRCRLVVESCRGVETLDSGEVSVRF